MVETHPAASKKNVLPPLDYLLAFEAAAKDQSFVAASRLLNISETAISRKVRLLEHHYGVQLFSRGHRSITLTPRGQSLLDSIKPALQLLREASQDLLSEQQRGLVTLAATNSVAALWLMPRLQQFHAIKPHVRINLVASDSDEECLAESVDLAILRGDGLWPGFTAHKLFGETIFPVCSPAFLRQNPEAVQLENLRSLALIEVASSHTEWMNWRAWLANNAITGEPAQRVTVFNTYPLSVQAAVDGLGLALGWGHLVDRLLEAGDLVRPVPDARVRTKSGYYLLSRDGNVPSHQSAEVERWLREISAARVRYNAPA